METWLLIATLLSSEPAQVYKSADGNQWTVTRQPRKSFGVGEEWTVRVERVGRDGDREVIEFDESFMHGQKALRYKRVEFSLDSKGVFQALESWTTESRTGNKPDQVTKVVQKWNGKAFERPKTP